MKNSKSSFRPRMLWKIRNCCSWAGAVPIKPLRPSSAYPRSRKGLDAKVPCGKDSQAASGIRVQGRPPCGDVLSVASRIPGWLAWPLENWVCLLRGQLNCDRGYSLRCRRAKRSRRSRSRPSHGGFGRKALLEVGCIFVANELNEIPASLAAIVNRGG
jgi:hypothetical protein